MTSEGASCDYAKGASYWAAQAPDVSGMLGGFENLSAADVKDSAHFLRLLQSKEGVGNGIALDCGSGIGRVTKLTLLPAFERVDMVDVTAAFLKNSPEFLGEELDNRIGERFVSGLQDFVPSEGRYDVVWIQWVSGYLTDDDFVSFLERCAVGLRRGGCVVVKENLCSVGDRDFDEEDSSYSRSRDCVVALALRAGLALFLEKKQRGWPEGMLAVRIFAFRPKLNDSTN